MGAIPPHADLVRAEGFRAVNGQPIQAIQEATLKSGAALVATWDHLEPIVRTLIEKVKGFVDDGQFDGVMATKLLSQCAGIVQKLGHTGQGILRASEGLSKLALLLDVGKVKRAHPGTMTEKQLASLLIETLKKLGEDGPCPVCKTVKALEVTDGSA